MHLLFVTSLVPQGVASTGYEIANQAVIDGLRRVGARVTVIGFTWPGRAASDPENTVVLGSVDVQTEGADALTKVKWVAQALSGGWTISSAKMRIISEGVLRQAIDRHGPFDAYVLNGVSLPGAFANVFADLPSLWIAHNVEFASARANALSADSAVKRALFRRDARILETLEQQLAAQARFVFTFAEEDRAPLGIASPSRSAVLPLVTLREPPAPARQREISYDAGLIGTWSWQPNRVGLDWFVQEVAPRLPDGFTVAMAGNLPGGLPNAPANIRFLGRVPDAKQFVRSCAVIPLVAKGGTGVQLKTIETFEMGLPAVATSSSVRGISFRPENCQICDDPQAFVAGLVRAAASVRAGNFATLDGTAFYNGQRSALDAALRQGLARLNSLTSAGLAA